MPSKKPAFPAKAAAGKGKLPPEPPVDRRVTRSKERVLSVALEILQELGLHGVTVDEIVRRSGVAKTTIYRHWPARAELILATCSQLNTQQQVPDTGSLRGDLTQLLLDLAHLLRTAPWAAVLPSVIDAGERDADIAKLYARQQRGHEQPYYDVIERARLRGELPAVADPSALCAALTGPLFYRRWFSRTPIDEAFVRGIVSQALAPLTPSPAYS